MVKINKIYTKTGDSGDTRLVGGVKVRKSSARVKAYGEVDSLNSNLGMVRTLSMKDKDLELENIISKIQNDLFDIGSIIATEPGQSYPGARKFSDPDAQRLEQLIDRSVMGLPELKSFVLPGGTELNSWLHIARTSCRKVELMLWSLGDADQEDAAPPAILIYLNRLSDLLFALARRECSRAKVAENLWIQHNKT